MNSTPDSQGPSTRPYLLRALHSWCTDNGYTPYVSVHVDDTVVVPREYVKDGEITLNIGIQSTSGLLMGNEFIEFKARFGGVVREVVVPVDHVLAIYARENGQGMAFPMPAAGARPRREGADSSAGVPASDGTAGRGEGAPAGTAARGLRLASLEGAAPSLTPSSPATPLAPDASAEPEPPEPPEPGGPPGSRPTLKRIK